MTLVTERYSVIPFFSAIDILSSFCRPIK